MRKLEAMARTLNDDFQDHLAEVAPEQHAWLGAWSEGYGKALSLVRDADRRRPLT